MTSQEALNLITSIVKAKEDELSALKLASQIITDGFQSDTDRITAQTLILQTKADALEAENITLKADNKSLNDQLMAEGIVEPIIP